MNFLQVRFSYDDPLRHGLDPLLGDMPAASKLARARLLSDAVKITPSLFPGLSKAFEGISESMGLGMDVECFVRGDAEMQAWCVPHRSSQGNSFSVVISSAIVERLEPSEIRFVVGHEIGHFLCEHWRYPKESDSAGLGERLASLRLSRSAEISADRIGMMAARSLEESCGAMIKVAAGLGLPHVRPDIPSLLGQFRELSSQDGDAGAIWATHPIIPLRIRALLRFEPICLSLLKGTPPDARDLERVDEAIEADFLKATGNALQRLNDSHLESARIWGLMFLFCADGVISKAEQELLSEAVGKERSRKTLKFIGSQDRPPAEVVAEKLTTASRMAREASLEARASLLLEFEQMMEDAGLLDGPIHEAMNQLRSILL